MNLPKLLFMWLKRILLLAGFLHCAFASQAQLCQGSLGDPIANITFGAGTNPGSPLSAATTSYRFSSSDCVNDGFYTVRNRSDNCYGSWHSLSRDHTGDPNGYFMLVNASNDPGAFYIDTVDLFCSNTSYEFAAWVVNMNRPSECNGNPRRPNLTFSIEATDGTVLQTFNSGDIAPQTALTWRQYGFFFSTPTNVNKVVLRITNNAPGGCGNDLALDDITFRPCGPLVTSSIGGSGNVINFCEGEGGQVQLNSNVSPGFGNPYFQWQESTNNGATWRNIPGANAQAFSYSIPSAAPAGTYLYRLSVSKIENSAIAACRVNSGVLSVRINKKPIITINNSGPVCEGSDVRLSATGGTQYLWTDANGNTSSGQALNFASAHPSQSGLYYVTATNAEGCHQIDSTNLLIHPKPVAAVTNPVTTVCEGDTVQLIGAGAGNYLWKPGVGLSSNTVSNPYAFPDDSTDYLLVVSNSFGCSDSAYASVNVNKKPVAAAGPDISIAEGQRIPLQATVSPHGVMYQWSPPEFISDINALRPLVNPPADKTYVLTVTSNAGCGVATDSVHVKVFKGIFVPTAFTPNSDNKNDTWLTVGLSVYSDYEIYVFNRYGEVVFRSKDASAGWNGMYKGKILPNGVYPYLITVKDISLTLKGLLTIIR